MFDDPDIVGLGLAGRRRPAEDTPSALDRIVEEAVQKAETVERDAKRLEGAGVNLGTLTQLHINAAVRKAREAEHAATTQPDDQATIVAQEAVSKADQAAKRLADDRKQPRNADAVAKLLVAEAKAAKQKFREAQASADGTPDEDPAVTRAKRAAKAAKKAAKDAAKTADLVRENEQTRRVTEAEKSRRGLSFGHIVLAILVALFVWYVVLPMGLMAGCAAILAAVAGQAAG